MSTAARTAVRRLAVARLISIGGGAAAYAALMFYVYQRTHSAAWLSVAVLVTFGVQGLFSPIAGALGDRFDRRKVMIWSDLLGAGSFAAMTFVKDPGWLLVLAFVGGMVELPFYTASGAAIPNLVGAQDLSWANGLIQMGSNAGIMVGPAIGGLVYGGIEASGVFAANAVTFVVSAALVASVPGRFSGDRADAGEHRGLRAGFRFLARDRVLRAIVYGWMGIVLGMGLAMVADVPFVDLFGAGSVGYGVLIGCWGAGSVLGSFAGRWLNERREPRLLVGGVVLVAVTTIGVAVSPIFWVALAFVLFAGTGDALTFVAGQGIQQRRTPDAVRSRVMAASDTIEHVAFVIALLVAGAVLDAVGPRGAYAIGGLKAALGAGVMVPAIREELRRTKTAIHEQVVSPDEVVVAG